MWLYSSYQSIVNQLTRLIAVALIGSTSELIWALDSLWSSDLRWVAKSSNLTAWAPKDCEIIKAHTAAKSTVRHRVHITKRGFCLDIADVYMLCPTNREDTAFQGACVLLTDGPILQTLLSNKAARADSVVDIRFLWCRIRHRGFGIVRHRYS